MNSTTLNLIGKNSRDDFKPRFKRLRYSSLGNHQYGARHLDFLSPTTFSPMLIVKPNNGLEMEYKRDHVVAGSPPSPVPSLSFSTNYEAIHPLSLCLLFPLPPL